MSKPIISVENLGKSYLIGHDSSQREQYHSLRDSMMRQVKGFGRKALDMVRGRQILQGDEVEEFWALKDVSFDVQPGEVIGIIGRNGAGKSTLLKILSRITEPTEGSVKLGGRVASLLEVGTGFHPELTGRENIFLNGAILGMTRAEIKNKFDEIVAFAEVEKFLDTPVKRYSSGMYVRLAFAVAAHLEPEILVVDEVLAVGDAAFQKKCLGKMEDVSKRGRAVLFVSHNMGTIQRLCSKTVCLDKGRVLRVGETEEIIPLYLSSGVTTSGSHIWPDGLSDNGIDFFSIREANIKNNSNEVTTNLDVRNPFQIEIIYQIKKKLRSLRIGIRIDSFTGVILFGTYDTDSVKKEGVIEPGIYASKCILPGQFFNTDSYYVTIHAEESSGKRLARAENILSFSIENSGVIGNEFNSKRYGLIRPLIPWEIERK